MVEPSPGVIRLRLDLAYDGTDFSGWAPQPGRRTVRDVLESALTTVLRVPQLRLTVAGRTDAGVHATGQVAHVDVPLEADPLADGTRLLRRLAGVLPADVQVHRVSVAPPGFDARFAALWRRYEYRLADGAAGASPLVRRSVLSWPRHLDETAMQQAADRLGGLHDFAAFCRRREGATTIRELQRLAVERVEDQLVCTVQADAFCHSMVRSLIGALITVGEGRRAVDWPGSLLTLGRRCDDVPVVPPHGLTLVHVEYPPDAELVDRVERTRNVRGAMTVRSIDDKRG
jgi:tRNA pseudouridine38-40 synthase